MSKLLKKFKRSVAIVLSITTFAWALGPVALLMPTQVLAAEAKAGDLIKMNGLSSVYYLGADSKRYVFPNETTFKSWYGDFSSVKTIAQSELESYSLGSNNATIRPGTKLVKITTNPKVYAVEDGGILKAIPDEATAKTLYGADWAKRVVDVPDAFFMNYTKSDEQVSATAYPKGTLIKYAGSADIYLVDSATTARKIASTEAMTANRYKDADVVTAPSTIVYTSGTAVTAAESALVDLSKTGVTAGTGAVGVGTGLTVSLSSASVASGTIITGQAVADLGSFNFAAGNDGDVKVTTFKVKRGGVSADATLTNVYLYDGATRLTDNASVSSGYVTWANSAGIFTVSKGTTKTISVKSDIASDATGQTVSVAVQAAADITTDGATVSGTFPISTNVMSVASATLAGVTLAIDTTPAGIPTVDPQDGYTMWSNSINFGTRAVYLNSLTFRQIGSVLKDDLKNFKLYVSGTQVGDTVASVDANGYIAFKPASPYKVEAGSREVKVIGDIVGGSSRNFILSLRRAADAIFVDSEYNANVLITGNANGATTAYAYAAHDSGTIKINLGELAITKATDSPTGNVINNGSQVVLGKFQLKATGESMKVENLRINYAASDATIKELRNGALFYNGKQVGSTADIHEDSDTSTYTEYSLGSSVIVVPGTPGILEVKADVYDGEGTTNHATAGDTIQVKVDTGSSNVQRQISLGYISGPASAVTAITLTIAEGSLVLSKDQNYGSQSVVAPTTATKLAQFTLNTGTTEAVNLNTLTVDLAFADAFAAADLTNVYVKYGTKETSAKSTVSATANANTWSINEAMLANANMTIEIYGDVAAAATNSDATADTVIASLKVTGTTANSGTTVYTGAGATGTVLAGQTITATGAGTLTVQLADDTPAASIAVAGTQPTDGSIKLKLTSAREVIYVKTLTFRSDVNADDVALASADLYAGQAGNLVKINGNKTFNIDGDNPGYFSWTLSGTDRIQVPKDGTTYVLVKPTYVSSAQESTISGKTPALFLADLEAEGASVLTPSSGTPNLTIDTGIILSAGGSSTFATSAKTLGAAVSSATATSLTCTTGDVFSPGDIIFVDTYNAAGAATPDTKWNAAYEELMVVLADGTTALTVDRGAFGTTAIAAYDSGDIIYILDTGASSVNNIIGSAVTVLKTKSKIVLAGDSPSGSATGGTQKVVYKFTVVADNNSLDSAENKVSLTQLDLTTTKSGTTVKNVKIYPADFDQNDTYAVTGRALSSTKWRLVMSGMAGNQYQILEGASKTYVVRADIGSGTNASNSLDVSIASIASGGDVTWSDGTTATNWVDQPGATYISGSALTYGASSGTADTVPPTITAIAITDATHNNNLAVDDTIALTFSEMIDPTTVKSTGLIPDGTTYVAITDGATGDITAKDPSGAGNDYLEIKNIINLSTGADTLVTADAGSLTCAVSAMLDTTGTILTLKVTTALTGDGEAGATQTVVADSGGTTVKDVNGTAMTATGSNSATVTSDAI